MYHFFSPKLLLNIVYFPHVAIEHTWRPGVAPPPLPGCPLATPGGSSPLSCRAAPLLCPGVAPLPSRAAPSLRPGVSPTPLPGCRYATVEQLQYSYYYLHLFTRILQHALFPCMLYFATCSLHVMLHTCTCMWWYSSMGCTQILHYPPGT